MPDYQKMYYTLCAGVATVLDDMPDYGLFRPYRQKLKTLLLEAEDIYIQTDNVVPFPGGPVSEQPPGQSC